jgi:hypothetical protein
MDRPAGVPAVGSRPVGVPRPQPIFCGPGGNRKCAFDVNSWCPIGVLCSSPSTLEEKDVRRCRKNGSPRAGCRPDSSGAARGMRLAAGPAAAATGCRFATATASDAACPRLTGGEGRLEDPILDYRTNDLIAIDRATCERQEARTQRAVCASIACATAAATQVPDMWQVTCACPRF